VQRPLKLDRKTYRRISAFAEGIDDRTVKDYYEGRRKTQAPTVAAIRRALAVLNLPDPRAEVTP